ncbi:lamin tail domain-containing protein, partial [bacterium]|nr:lamin tail domain-containing protein [bacterium]
MNKNKYFQILFATLLFSRIVFLGGQTVSINEVMFNAVGADFYDEFIEIVNYGDSTISLQGTYLLINGSVDTLDFPNSDTLAPNSYALILDIDYHNSGTYDEIIPESTLLLTIQDKYFADKGLSDNEPDTLFLISESGDTLSSVITTPDQDAGYSDEKILLDGPNEPGNWGNSNILYGTPGFKNSISPRDFDLAIIAFGLLYDDTFPEPGATVEFYLTIRNVGLNAVNDAELVFGIDSDGDSILRIEEILYTDILSIEAGDSVVLYPTLPNVQSGQTVMISSIISEDDAPGNNTFLFDLKVPYRAGCVVINEFMYAPKSDWGGEWIELLNVSQDTINMIHWTIADNSNRVFITEEDVLIPPETYVVLSSDSTLLYYWDVGGVYVQCTSPIPTLNNTSDSIVVRDLCGKTIDALGYSSSWGYQQGVSLERINPFTDGNNSDNWELSNDQAGGTPGTRNSRMIKDIDLEMDYIETQPQCARHGEPIQMNYGIKNTGMNSVYQYSVRFTVVSQAAMSDSDIVFESTITVLDSIESGKTHTGSQIIETINGGAYQLFAAVICQGDELTENDQDSCLFTVGGPENAIVLNEFMYVPKSDWGGEWIELLNVSQDTINMIHWT